MPTLFCFHYLKFRLNWRSIKLFLKLRTRTSRPLELCGTKAFVRTFSTLALVEDVHHCVVSSSSTTSNSNIVLLGHSMGARITLTYAATYPECISCLILEDMDLGRWRRSSDAPFSVARDDVPFQRSFASQTEAIHALVQAGCHHDRVHRWVRRRTNCRGWCRCKLQESCWMDTSLSGKQRWRSESCTLLGRQRSRR
jgi:hypothetical protein